MSKAASLAGLLAFTFFLPGISAGDEANDLRFALRNLQASDARLNQGYRDAMTRLDPTGQASLKAVQRAWIAFKEADSGLFEQLVRPTGRTSQVYFYKSAEEGDQASWLARVGSPPPMSRPPSQPDASAQEDQLLNKIYRQLVTTVPPEMVASEKAVQISWIRFRDLYSQFDASQKGGVPDNNTLDQLTHRRAVQLQAHLAYALKMRFPVAESERPEDSIDEQPTDLPMADPFRFAK